MEPPLTTKQRVWTIAQLCIGFSMLLWHLCYPFTGFYATVESQRLLYQTAMGTASAEGKLQRNYERFLALPATEQLFLKERYQALQTASERSFLSKTADAVERLLWQLPPFEIAWLIFSILIPLFILLRWEGATAAAWLLPCLVICYGIDGRVRGEPFQPTAEELLFPSETYLISNYLSEPLSPSILEQQNQLKKAWERYLVAEWTGQESSAEAGEQAFTIARIHALDPPSTAPKFSQPSWLALILYLLWNLLFAANVKPIWSSVGFRGNCKIVVL